MTPLIKGFIHPASHSPLASPQAWSRTLSITFTAVAFYKWLGAALSAPGPWEMKQACAAEPGAGKAKSVLIMLSGGPSQLDMFDPKPEAPAEVRGEFSAISTTIPGVAVCEAFAQICAETARWSIVRSLAHREHNHLLATHVALTGRPTPLPRGGSDLDRVETRNDFPNFAACSTTFAPEPTEFPMEYRFPITSSKVR